MSERNIWQVEQLCHFYSASLLGLFLDIGPDQDPVPKSGLEKGSTVLDIFLFWSKQCSLNIHQGTRLCYRL